MIPGSASLRHSAESKEALLVDCALASLTFQRDEYASSGEACPLLDLETADYAREVMKMKPP